MTNRHPELIKHYSQSTQIIIIKVSNRIDSGRNALIGLFGATGSGKSLSAIELMRGIYLYRRGEEPTNEYLISHTFFRASKFMEAMKEVSDDLMKGTKRFKKGEAWLWDEVGVEAGHKEAMTMKNRVVGWLAQTFRNQQQIVLFTTPSISFIDATVRKMLHYYFESLGIDTKNKICVIKPLEMQYNPRLDKIYYHNFKYPTKKDMIEVDFIGIPKVTDEMEKLYETKKNQFTDNLNEQILVTLRRIENKEREVIHRPAHREIYELYHNKTKVVKEIAEKVGVAPSTLSGIMKTMDKWYANWRITPNLLGNWGKEEKKEETEPSGLKLENPTKNSENVKR